MNFLIITVFVVAAKCVSQSYSKNFKIQREFEKFKTNFQKHYSSNEHAVRSRIFADNFKLITKHNKLYKKGLVTFSVGINKFADRTEQELAEMTSCGSIWTKGIPIASKYKPPKFMHVPDYWNWTAQGAVTDIKNQGKCASCYAFSGIAAIEGQYALKKGMKRQLSEQNIVDCGKNGDYEMNGCDCGDPWEVYRYVRDYGVQAQSNYPYTGKEGKCRYDPRKVVARVKSFKMISQNEDHLKKAIYQIGPISVSMFVRKPLIKLYTGGIYYDPDCDNGQPANHDLLAVGYGTMDGDDYWIVKNSRGADGGLNGYLLVARNKNNSCGIVTSATYPIII